MTNADLRALTQTVSRRSIGPPWCCSANRRHQIAEPLSPGASAVRVAPLPRTDSVSTSVKRPPVSREMWLPSKRAKTASKAPPSAPDATRSRRVAKYPQAPSKAPERPSQRQRSGNEQVGSLGAPAGFLSRRSSCGDGYGRTREPTTSGWRVSAQTRIGKPTTLGRSQCARGGSERHSGR
jgi:hypothetical protein